MCWKLLHLVPTFLVGCFGILLTWNTVRSFFAIGVTVLYCLDSCESVVCLAPYYCLLLSKFSVRRAIVIALSIVSSGSVCSLSDRFESRVSPQQSDIGSFQRVRYIAIVAIFC